MKKSGFVHQHDTQYREPAPLVWTATDWFCWIQIRLSGGRLLLLSGTFGHLSVDSCKTLSRIEFEPEHEHSWFRCYFTCSAADSRNFWMSVLCLCLWIDWCSWTHHSITHTTADLCIVGLFSERCGSIWTSSTLMDPPWRNFTGVKQVWIKRFGFCNVLGFFHLVLFVFHCCLDLFTASYQTSTTEESVTAALCPSIVHLHSPVSVTVVPAKILRSKIIQHQNQKNHKSYYCI